MGPFFNVGVAYPLRLSDDQQLLLAADLLDATDEINSMINVGVEFQPCANWAIRAGMIDTDCATAGLGYNGGAWQMDVAWQESSSSSRDDEIATTCSYVLK